MLQACFAARLRLNEYTQSIIVVYRTIIAFLLARTAASTYLYVRTKQCYVCTSMYVKINHPLRGGDLYNLATKPIRNNYDEIHQEK